MGPIIQGMLIGVSGGTLYFVVDKYEPDRRTAYVLKLLIVLWAIAAVLHYTKLFGGSFF